MFDPEMKYCLACGDEYMPQIKQCGICGADLKSGAEMLRLQELQKEKLAARRGALTPDDDIATIFKGPLADVKRIQQQLEKENIGTLVVGHGASCGKSCCAPEVELRIRRDDAAIAIRIIEADFAQMTGSAGDGREFADLGYDPEANESTCPACGFNFSTSTNVCPDCGLCFG